MTAGWDGVTVNETLLDQEIPRRQKKSDTDVERSLTRVVLSRNA